MLSINRRVVRCISFVIFAGFILCDCFVLKAQDSLSPPKLKIYLDGLSEFDNYIKVQIDFVDYVRDRLQSDVHLLTTTIQTGSGGKNYSLNFIGRNSFAGRNDTLHFISNANSTQQEIREGITQLIKLGLMQYIARLPNYIPLSIVSPSGIALEPEKYLPVKDKWHHWVFSIYGYGSGNASETQTNFTFGGEGSIAHVTDKWKAKLTFGGSYSELNYEKDTVSILSRQNSQKLNFLLVRSLTQHWSVGATVFGYSSSFSNYKAQIVPSVGAEYSIFPYSQATSRLLTFRYLLSPAYSLYYDTTVYFKKQEFLFSHSINFTGDFIQKWGSINTFVSASDYIPNAKYFSINANATLNLRIAKGLFLQATGDFTYRNGQFNIRNKASTLAEVLLQQKQLASNFLYSFSFGITYTFGSIYNSIVNPRFEHAIFQSTNSNYESPD